MTTVVAVNNLNPLAQDVLVRVVERNEEDGQPKLAASFAVQLVRPKESINFHVHSGVCLIVTEMPKGVE